MNIDTIQTIVRSVLKVGGGALVANGVAEAADWEAVVGGVVALIGIIWGVYHRKSQGAKANAAKNTNANEMLPPLVDD